MVTHASPAPAPRGLDPEISERIRIARTVCIFMMMFVHVQVGVADDVTKRPAEGLFDIAYFLLTRVFGLSSVALLSIVSGYLIVSTFRKLGTGRLYSAKFQTLIVPLLAWNSVKALAALGYALLSGHWDKLPDPTIMGVANGFLALTAWPLDVPLWFLRDLFVCTLFTPLVLYGLRRSAIVTFALLLLFALFGGPLLILQRPVLLLFFATGMWLRDSGMQRSELDRLAMPISLLLLPIVAVFLAVRLYQGSIVAWSETGSLAFDIALRFSMAAAMWRLTLALMQTRFGALCREIEPYVFFAFCSHAILFDFSQILLRRAFGDFGSDLFPLTFFSLPFAALACAVIGLQLIRRAQPLLYLLNAGRAVPHWPPRLESRPDQARAASPDRQRRKT